MRLNIDRGTCARAAAIEECGAFDRPDADARGQHFAVPVPVLRAEARTGMALREGELKRNIAGDQKAGEPVAEVDQLFGPEVRIVRGGMSPDEVLVLEDHAHLGGPDGRMAGRLGGAKRLPEPRATEQVIAIEIIDVSAA